MTMKMSPAHFARLENAIGAVCRNTMWPETYAAKTGHGITRVRWDYFNTSKAYDNLLSRDLYAAGHSDATIETALKRIIPRV